MWQKAGAAAIVLAIGGIAAAVLYSPLETEHPGVGALPLRIGPALHAIDPSQAGLLPAPAPRPAPHLSHLVGTATASYSVAPVLTRGFDRQPEPAPSVEMPSELTAVAAIPSMRPGMVVPAIVGQIPRRAPAKPGLVGPVRVAGQSLGTAFAVTGRSLRAAFKRAF